MIVLMGRGLVRLSNLHFSSATAGAAPTACTRTTAPTAGPEKIHHLDPLPPTPENERRLGR
jgi:hypothetical protein